MITCPICGRMGVTLMFHRCMTLGARGQPESTGKLSQEMTEHARQEAMLAEKDIPTQDTAERMYEHIGAQMVAHEHGCKFCLLCVKHAYEARCIEYLDLERLRKRWRRKVEAQ